MLPAYLSLTGKPPSNLLLAKDIIAMDAREERNGERQTIFLRATRNDERDSQQQREWIFQKGRGGNRVGRVMS